MTLIDARTTKLHRQIIVVPLRVVFQIKLRAAKCNFPPRL
jgi:hypothetical protein